MIKYVLHLSTGRQISSSDLPERREIERDWGYERWVTVTDIAGHFWQIRPEHLMAVEQNLNDNQKDQPASDPS